MLWVGAELTRDPNAPGPPHRRAPAEGRAPLPHRSRPPQPPAAAPEPRASAPEVATTYTPAGRQTLAAITAELGRGAEDDTPQIEIGHAMAGRETLAAIAEELLPPARRRHRTLGFEEARPVGDAPRPLGARADDLAARPSTEKPAPARPAPGVGGAFEIHEMITFVVRGDLSRLASERVRREFVRDHLAHRLPVASLDAVDRVDVTPWTVKGTVVVRVWCRVSPP